MAVEYSFGVIEERDQKRSFVRTKSDQKFDLPAGVLQTHTARGLDVTETHLFIVKGAPFRELEEGGFFYAWYDAEVFALEDNSPKALRELFAIMEDAQATRDLAAINFVASVQAGAIDAVTAGEHAELFLEWSENGVKYAVGDIRRDPLDGALYQVVQEHTSQTGWNPSLVPALWKRFADPAEEWTEWSQPYGAHDAYRIGAKCSRLGKHYINERDYNVQPPEGFDSGWREVTD